MQNLKKETCRKVLFKIFIILMELMGKFIPRDGSESEICNFISGSEPATFLVAPAPGVARVLGKLVAPAPNF